jgi:acid phosphatase
VKKGMLLENTYLLSMNLRRTSQHPRFLLMLLTLRRKLHHSGRGHELTSRLHPHFTHRESPAFVAVFINLFNDTSLANPSSVDPALDHRPLNRQWRTSHLVSFLGNIALERFECEPETEGGEVGEYVRAMVNGREKVMGGCEDGVGASCKWESWKAWLDKRNEKWGDWASVCEKKKD